MMSRFMLIPAVYVILRRLDGRILFLRRFQTGFRDGEYGLPSGHVDGGEAAIDAAVRELREETGLVVPTSALSFVHIRHRSNRDGYGERMDLYFEVTAWEGEPENREPEKHDRMDWLDPIAPDQGLVIDYLQTVLQHIADGEYYSNESFDR